ncbi:DUF177 domain-containing protein [Patescibacteria group bacterium]
MKQTGYIFDIGSLIRENQGTKYKFKFDEENTIKFEDNIKPKSRITADVTLMKVQEGIHVLIENMQLSLEVECSKCTTGFVQKIAMESTERVYFSEGEKEDSDMFDLFYVNKKALTVDIEDFLRQEIILHFQTIPVCSKSCKGLCPTCGANLNEENCSCDKHPTEEKPLAALKNLYKPK